MSDKKNVFGSLVIVEPCLELAMILDWIAAGNKHLLTENDWQEVELLANRCDDMGIVSVARAYVSRKNE